MYSIIKDLVTPIEYGYLDDIVTIEVTFYRSGEITSILVDDRKKGLIEPDEQITKVINEDLRKIQEDICWFLQNEKQEAAYFMNYA